MPVRHVQPDGLTMLSQPLVVHSLEDPPDLRCAWVANRSFLLKKRWSNRFYRLLKSCTAGRLLFCLSPT
ncbi:MAG: hypothetical protein KDC53_08255, partial [Saprospiraceae bacterium]|nr:hypothetical protein [Saprospiraceae bacterium]